MNRQDAKNAKKRREERNKKERLGKRVSLLLVFYLHSSCLGVLGVLAVYLGGGDTLVC
jgi:hypothetical protein